MWVDLAKFRNLAKSIKSLFKYIFKYVSTKLVFKYIFKSAFKYAFQYQNAAWRFRQCCGIWHIGLLNQII